MLLHESLVGASRLKGIETGSRKAEDWKIGFEYASLFDGN